MNIKTGSTEIDSAYVIFTKANDDDGDIQVDQSIGIFKSIRVFRKVKGNSDCM